jgi:hypothetical protein
MKRVGHKIASRVASPAEIDENFPVTRARRDKVHLFTRTKVFQKSERQSSGVGFLKIFGCVITPRQPLKASSDTATPAGSHRAVSSHDLISVLIGVLAMRADEDINVQQNHRGSIASRSAGDDLRSTPG